MSGDATPPELNEPRAEHLAGIALGHVTREWPHALSHVLQQPEDARTPRALHPVFYGSFDWHSCVHGYWLLAVLLRRFPDFAAAGAVRALFDTHLAPGPVAGECAYFARSTARGFERPYGWAWLLALQHAVRSTAWAEALQPLAAVIAERFRAYLPMADYPVRVGTHFNTAFALRLAATYAEAADEPLLRLLRAKAAQWYAADAGCQAWEPAQDDFLSPALIEAVCMRRLMPDGQFGPWLDRFLPKLQLGIPAVLFSPARVSDRTDGKIAHLDGLNLSRAWCWRVIGAELGGLAEAAAQAHVTASLDHAAGDFMGEHWLATFAVLALWPGALEA